MIRLTSGGVRTEPALNIRLTNLLPAETSRYIYSDCVGIPMLAVVSNRETATIISNGEIMTIV